ncbi:CRISPR-associated protein 1, partial [Dionaea muscipula]
MIGWRPSEEEEGLEFCKQAHESAADFDWVGVNHGSGVSSSNHQPLRFEMWRLKVAEGDSSWLKTTNNHVGRQVWEFDPNLGAPEELAEVEKARENFRIHRFEKKHSSDILMRLQ